MNNTNPGSGKAYGTKAFIITYAPYPNGMALTKRLHYYARAIQEAGGECEFLLPNPSSAFFRNHFPEGVYQGVRYRYTSKRATKPSSAIKRRWVMVTGFLRLVSIIIKNRKELDVLVDGGLPLFNKLIILPIAKWSRIIFIQEKSEFPFFRSNTGNPFKKSFQSFYKFVVPRMYHGTFVISDSLKMYYQSRISGRAGILLIPVLVDTEEFTAAENTGRKMTILSAGTQSELKDGTLTLIRAFSKLAQKHPGLSLTLVGGDPQSGDIKKAFALARELKIADRIKFTGFVSRGNLIKYQKEAEILVLAKPNSLHAEHCFPSKLAEYVSTSNPVVVTNTGEISGYLKDNENAFLVEPDSVDLLASRLDYVISNKEKAREVGENGFRVARDNFDYRKYGPIMLAFFAELKRRYRYPEIKHK